ncbi:hypothetical protein ACF0H5_021089 [Mactra antiquata]
MGITADANELRNLKDPISFATKSVKEKHANENCRYIKYETYVNKYKVFLLIRKCVCGLYENREEEVVGKSTLQKGLFVQSGLELHIDELERCAYHTKELPADGQFELEKICHCPIIDEKLQEPEDNAGWKCIVI